MSGKYKGYDPAPDSWDSGGMWRIEPETVLAWKAMPTATRWRFAKGRAALKEAYRARWNE